jgi:ribose transport system permease protein
MGTGVGTERMKSFVKQYGTVLGGLLIFVGFSLSTPYFFTTHNVLMILRQMSMLTMVSLGFTFVMAAGGFDMSIGYAMGLVSVFFGTVLNVTGSLLLATLTGLGLGIAVGAVNGLLVAYLHLPDFIATFAVGSMTLGAKMLYSGGHPIFLRQPPEAFRVIGRGFLGPIPVPVIIMVGVFALVWLILKRTRYGRHIYAIGGNAMAALYAGINVRWTRFLTFLISGLGVAVTAIVLTSRLGSAQPEAGENFLLDAISVCFLSTTMFGEGEPTPSGVFVGAFIITMLNSGLTMLAVPYHVQFITKGAVVILAVLLSVMLGRKVNIRLL